MPRYRAGVAAAAFASVSPRALRTSILDAAKAQQSVHYVAKELQILVARAHGKRLPLEEDEFTPGQEYISHTALSKWNESVQVQAPASSTPISTVRTG